MRVPICQQDLIAGSGFKRLAKRLKRDWPGTEPLRLSEAQEILARCLGYGSYHEVDQSAKTPQENVVFPPLQTLMADCLFTLWEELFKNGRCGTFNLGELQANIYSWPFLLLTVYRKHYGYSDNLIVGPEVRFAHMEAFLLTQMPSENLPILSKTGLPGTQLEAMVGHQSRSSTEAHVSNVLPIGVCPHDESSEKIQEQMGPPNTRCIDNVFAGKES